MDLEPLIARVNPDRCTWCGECLKACPYNAVQKISWDTKDIAYIVGSQCKGEGACVPVCPYDALDIEGYTDAQITAMIDASAPAQGGSMSPRLPLRDAAGRDGDARPHRRPAARRPADHPRDRRPRSGQPSPEVVCWVMAMRRYGMVEEHGKADADGYFAYALTARAAGEGGDGMRVSPALAAEVKGLDGFNASACLNCGVCTALCPLGYEILPRKMFRLVLLGLEERLAGAHPPDLLLPAVPHVRGQLPGRGAHRREHPGPAHRRGPPPPELRNPSMPLPTATVLGILGDNLSRRGSVLPLSKRTATRWAEGLGLPRGGDTVIYTGHMYQLIPSIDAMAGLLARLENSWVTRLFGLGRFVNRFVSLTFFMQLAGVPAQAGGVRRHAARHRRPAAEGRGLLRLPVRRRDVQRRPWRTTRASTTPSPRTPAGSPRPSGATGCGG